MCVAPEGIYVSPGPPLCSEVLLLNSPYTHTQTQAARRPTSIWEANLDSVVGDHGLLNYC